MSIELSAQAVALAEDAVNRGLVGSVSEALERALQLMAFHDSDPGPDWTPTYAAYINREIEVGMAALGAGHVVPGEVAIARARALVEANRTRA